MSDNTEVRSFQVSKHMIFHTIESQAGSIEKAILECLMNAVDAGATKVSVDFNDDGTYIVNDNGKGFRKKEEIYECFEVFGFDHGTKEENHRTYGTFGIGRAQLWAFSKNVWYTNNYELNVDIKNKGLDYDLIEVKDNVKGCKIVGEFYEKPSLVDLQNIIRELTKLALYLPIEFKLNGKVVNKDASKEKWNHETDEAYIKLNDTGDLHIYNLGVYVCSYANWRFGKGGVILSKDSLALNTARNDILLSKCGVWKKIKKYVEEKSTEDNLKRTSLTHEQRKNLVMQWISGSLNIWDLSGQRILPDIRGKYNVVSKLQKGTRNITICPTKGSQIGENIHTNEIAYVFPPEIKDWFNVDSVNELAEVLNSLITRHHRLDKNLVIPVEFEELQQQYKSDKSYVDPKKYTKKQKAAMKVLNIMAREIPKLINETRRTWGEEASTPRTVKIGASDSAAAWTDGVSFIAIDKDFITENIKYGLGGLAKIGNVMLHEYLHENNSMDDHIHSHEFFEEFHDILTQSYKFFYIYKDCMISYIKECIKLELSIPRQYVRDERAFNENEKTVGNSCIELEEELEVV